MFSLYADRQYNSRFPQAGDNAGDKNGRVFWVHALRGGHSNNGRFYNLIYGRNRMKKLYALRGAFQCLNTEKDIMEQTALTYDELLSANSLPEEDIVSLMFSVTDDIDALNPCTALRKSGRALSLALFGVREAECTGSLPRTIRALAHCYLEEGSQARHVYRNGAEILRPDRK
jgi:chorismate mutase